MSKGDLTVREVAEKFGVKEHQVRYAIKIGAIKAYKKGWMVLVKRKSLPKKWPVAKGVG